MKIMAGAVWRLTPCCGSRQCLYDVFFWIIYFGCRVLGLGSGKGAFQLERKVNTARELKKEGVHGHGA